MLIQKSTSPGAESLKQHCVLLPALISAVFLLIPMSHFSG